MSELLAYVSCADERAIVTFAMDRATGVLTRRASTQVPGPTGPGMSMPLAFSPDRRVLHAAVRIAPFPCSSFAVDPATGALAHLGAANLDDAMAYIVVEPSGRALLAASYPGAIATLHDIGADGAVTAPARQVIDTPLRAHAVITDAAGRFAYVPCLGGDVVLQLAIDAEGGRMVQVGRLRTHAGCGPRHMRFSPCGRFAYVLGELDATITACAVDSQGRLSAQQAVAILPRGFSVPAGKRIMAADIHITPDGRFLCASARRTAVLSAWRIGPGGALSPVGSIGTEPMPRGFAIDPSGRFLLCASQTTGAVQTYAIDPGTGALMLLARTPAGANANWIEFLETTGA
jgi:6-phosphogluconolactonase